MSRLSLPSSVKVDKYVLLYIDPGFGGYIKFTNKGSVYLLLPAEIRDTLNREYGLNFHKEPKQVQVTCELVIEQEEGNPSSTKHPKLTFTFKRRTTPEDIHLLKQKLSQGGE